MPVGVYERSDIHRKRIGEIIREKWKDPTYKERMCKALSKAKKGKFMGKDNPFYGKRHTPEARAKVAQSLLGKKGPLARNWRGGLEENKEHRKERHRIWSKNNPEKIKRILQKRQALLRGGGELLLEIVQRVYEKNIKCFGTLTCIYCLNPIRFGSDTLEHIIPLNKDGTNKYENLGVACKSCNSSKQDLLLEEWFRPVK